MPKKQLTDKQRETLDFIKGYIAKRGTAPTLFEIAVAAECTTNGALSRVTGLERKGYIARTAGAVRSIQLI